jgi:hypothetical protein
MKKNLLNNSMKIYRFIYFHEFFKEKNQIIQNMIAFDQKVKNSLE